VACTGLCPDVPVQIGGEHFRIDFYVISLGGYEVVLGCQWLRTLGPILWDFDRLPMGVIGSLANSSLARIWSQASPSLSKSMQSVRVW
jgi:hypothetical protein